MTEDFNPSDYTTFEPIQTPFGEQIKAVNPESGHSRLVSREEILQSHGIDPNELRTSVETPQTQENLGQESLEREAVATSEASTIAVEQNGDNEGLRHEVARLSEQVQSLAEQIQGLIDQNRELAELRASRTAAAEPAKEPEENPEQADQEPEPFTVGEEVPVLSLYSLGFERGWHVQGTYEKYGKKYVKLTKEPSKGVFNQVLKGEGKEPLVKEVEENALRAWKENQQLRKELNMDVMAPEEMANPRLRADRLWNKIRLRRQSFTDKSEAVWGWSDKNKYASRTKNTLSFFASCFFLSTAGFSIIPVAIAKSAGEKVYKKFSSANMNQEDIDLERAFEAGPPEAER